MTTTTVGYHLMVRLRGPGGLDRLEDLVRDEYTLGRGDPTKPLDFAIPEDEYLSRLHCRLVKAGETYAVENLSPNGTRVNGKAITQITPLRHKDRVEAGSSTVLEFLALSDEERSKDLEAGGTGGATEVLKKAKATKPFTKRPIFFGIVGFYALLMIAVVGAANQSAAPTAVDPGPGPYFRWMLRAPLVWDAEESHRQEVARKMWEETEDRTPADARERITDELYDRARLRVSIPEAERKERANTMWAAAVAEHGGEARGQGAHDYYLIRAALDVLGAKGFMTWKSALDVKDPVAVEADEALHGKDGAGGLEARLSRLYLEATRFAGWGHYRAARERCAEIHEAIPDRYIPLRQWASERLAPPKQ